MDLSILDLSPISNGKSATHSLNESLKLAQVGEKLGFKRYWIAEHHNTPDLSCSCPEIMLAYIGANTTKIRLGSGALLLPYYKPFKVVENFNMLATLFPDRIDLGIGRGPGGSDDAKIALSNNYVKDLKKMPELINEINNFIFNDFPKNHKYENIKPYPLPEVPPQPWLLGTTLNSALVASANGLPYAYGHFISDKNGTNIVKTYQENFQKSTGLPYPKTIVSISVICAETKKKAEEIALSEFIWNLQLANGKSNLGIPSISSAMKYRINEYEKEELNETRKKMIIGCPTEVKDQLLALQNLYNADEIMIITNTYSIEDRIKSYELISKIFIKKE